MRKVFKVSLCIIGGILLLMLGLVIYINSEWGQNFVRGRAEAYLKNKLKTEVHIGHLGYGIPKFIVLNDVLFLDQVRDTLLSVNTLKVDLDMFKLIRSKVDVQQVILKGVHSHIYRNAPDTNYNFTYILNAFASKTPETTAKQKESSGALSFSLDKVKLDDIHIRVDDITGGMVFAADLNHLDLRMKKLDVDSMLYHIKELSADGLQITYAQDTSYLPVNPNPTQARLKLVAENVSLQRIGLQYNDNLNKLLFGMKLGDLQLQLNNFDLDDYVIDIKKLVTKNSNVVLTMGSLTTAPAFIDSIVKIDSTFGWHINAKDVDFADVSFKMDDQSKPKQKLGVDYFHLDLQHTKLVMNDFKYTSDTIAGSIKHFSGTEQCGLDVRELRTDFNYNPTGATLSNLYFQTPNSIVQDHLEVHYPSVTEVAKRPQILQLNLHVVKSIVGLHDLLMFAPQLNDQEIFRKYRNGRFRTEATVTGSVNDMNIAHFYAAGMDNTEVVLNGRLSGLPEVNDLSYNMNITRFQSSRKDVSMLVPDSLLTAIRLPDKFGVTGLLAGTMTDYNVNLLMTSTDGRAFVKGLLVTSPGKGKERFDMQVRTEQLNIGRIIKQDSMIGEVTANVNVKGHSFDIKAMTATADANVFSAMIKGYRYHAITMDGRVANRQGDINMRSMDPNLQVLLTGHGDFNNKYPAIVADIKIDSIDLQALKLYKTQLRARGTIHADFPELNPDYPRGSFVWWQPVVVADGKRYFMDSVYVISRPSADTGQNIFVNLDVLQATMTGKTPLTKIGAIVQDHINRHYTFPVKDSISAGKVADGNKDFRIKVNPGSAMASHTIARDTTTIPADYNLDLKAEIFDKPLLHSLLPGLTSFESVKADASLTPRTLALNVQVPKLVYGTSIVQNGIIQIRGTDSAFTYKITADQVHQSKFVFWYANVHGNLDQNTLTTNVSLSDPSGKERFALAASLAQSGDSQIIQLQPGLRLDYNEWTVAQPNRIVLAKGGFYVRNFEISNSGQFIKAGSLQPQINAPVDIDISNFRLSNITNVVSSGDTLLADGILGGKITIQRFTPSPQISADLQVQNLSVLRDTLGDIQLVLSNKAENVLDTRLTLKGQGNDIAMAGAYYIQPQNGNDFDFNLDVNALALRSFETIAMKEIRNSSGFIRGNLKIQGKINAPQVTGALQTDNLVTTISRLNTEIKMPAEKIVFDKHTIVFNNFTMNDGAGNKATITGDIGTEYLPELDLNLKLNADNWRAVHSTVKDNKDYYGDLFLTTKLTIKGTNYAPYVDGNLFILKGTKLTVVNPDATPQMQNTKGIIEFVNMRDTAAGKYLVVTAKDSTRRKFAPGTDININISVAKEAEFNLLIDQASGDFLTVKGEAFLNTSVTPGGVVSLNGIYALHSGAYQLNYNFIKRKFLIQDGSTITFSGDPVKGTSMNVTAVYEANIPPYDLVMRQVPDPVQLNYFKQSVLFDITLHLQGPVLQPVIKFDVVLPENKVRRLAPDQVELVQAKLSQLRMDTTELNKQVFAVLILGRFVSDDPFSSSSTGLEYTALQSVSTFIGEQLNQAAGKLVKGVDLSVNLATSEDYTTGSLRRRTDLNLAASKRLMNDRLKLTIGNNFELEGPQTSSQQTSYVPSNLAADYSLTSDGRYTLRAYRRTYDEGVLQGFVTETGVNFIVSLDYNRFKYIFKKRKPRTVQPKAAGQ